MATTDETLDVLERVLGSRGFQCSRHQKQLYTHYATWERNRIKVQIMISPGRTRITTNLKSKDFLDFEHKSIPADEISTELEGMVEKWTQI